MVRYIKGRISSVFITDTAYLQAISNALQLQSLPSQNHLGAGGALRHHEAGTTFPIWAV